METTIRRATMRRIIRRVAMRRAIKRVAMETTIRRATMRRIIRRVARIYLPRSGSGVAVIRANISLSLTCLFRGRLIINHHSSLAASPTGSSSDELKFSIIIFMAISGVM